MRGKKRREKKFDSINEGKTFRSHISSPLIIFILYFIEFCYFCLMSKRAKKICGGFAHLHSPSRQINQGGSAPTHPPENKKNLGGVNYNP